MSNVKRINVLIVEDEPTIAQMLKEYLESVSSSKSQYWFSCIVVGSKKQEPQGPTISEEQLGGNEALFAFKNAGRYLMNNNNKPNTVWGDHTSERNDGYFVDDLSKQNQYGNESAEDAQNFHLILLDIMLPLKDGYQILQEIREIDRTIPIIMLSAKNVKEDRERGFRLGADDYVSKPYSFQELDHRIKNILRRTDNQVSSSNYAVAYGNAHPYSGYNAREGRPGEKIFNIGGYIFDYVTRTMIKDNPEKEEIRLSFKENELLYMLCKGSGDSSILGSDEIGVGRGIVERNHILNKIWRDNSYYKSRSMDVYMSKLRKFFIDNPRVEIVTLHGSGYRIVVHNEEKLKQKKEKALRKMQLQALRQNPYLPFTDPSFNPNMPMTFNPNFMHPTFNPMGMPTGNINFPQGENPMTGIPMGNINPNMNTGTPNAMGNINPFYANNLGVTNKPKENLPDQEDLTAREEDTIK